VLGRGQTVDAVLARGAGLVARTLDGRRCATKTALLGEFARALGFPAEAGRNWDAFEECLADLEWLPGSGYLVVVTDGDALLRGRDEDYATFVDVVEGVGREWAERHRPFHVVVAVDDRHRAARADWRLPRLTR
jgi:hypothetical protein